MHIVLVGLNHRTAPVALREQFSLTDCGIRMATEDLGLSRQPKISKNFNQETTRIKEAVLLSTCNRFEMYAVVACELGNGRDMVEGYLADLQGLDRRDLHPHLYFHSGPEAVSHLMRVAAGLDSMVLGESQILGQVSSAQADARRTESIGPILNHLFDCAVHAGKRSRTETDIGRHSTSVSHTAVRLAAEELYEFAHVDALVVGAGEMAESAARALLSEGVGRISFINRTFARAERMALAFSGEALNWTHLPAALTKADLVVTATGAPHLVIRDGDVLPVLPDREGRPLLIVDIAVPRDVEETVGDLAGVVLHDIDELQSVVDSNISMRQAAVPDVETIIAQEAARYDEWLRGRQVLPVLVELRQKARKIAEGELRRHEHRLGNMPASDREMVDRIVRRLVNKLLHEPTVRLKASAAEGNGVEYAHAIRELFDLNGQPEASIPDSNGKQLSDRQQVVTGDDPGENGRPIAEPFTGE